MPRPATCFYAPALASRFVAKNPSGGGGGAHVSHGPLVREVLPHTPLLESSQAYLRKNPYQMLVVGGDDDCGAQVFGQT